MRSKEKVSMEMAWKTGRRKRKEDKEGEMRGRGRRREGSRGERRLGEEDPVRSQD